MADYEATRNFEIPDLTSQERNAKRRRKLADDMLQGSMSGDIGQGYQGGRIYIVGNPLGNVAKAIGGAYLGTQADEADQTEAEQVQSVRKELLNRMSPEQRSAAEMALTPGMEELGKASYASSLKGDSGFTLGEGQQRFDKDGKPIASVAAKPEQQPPSVREFQYAQENGYKGDFLSYAKHKAQSTKIFAPRAEQRDRYQVIADADGGQYRVNLDTGEKLPLGMSKPAPAGGKLPAPAQKSQQAIMNLESGLNAYNALLDKFDPQSADAGTPAKRAELGTAFTDMQMRLKEAYELGAITGPDMAILENALSDPTSLKGTLKGAAFGRDPFKAQTGQVGKVLNRLKGNFESQYGVAIPAAAGNAPATPTAVRTGTLNGRKVQQMSDGTVRYVN